MKKRTAILTLLLAAVMMLDACQSVSVPQGHDSSRRESSAVDVDLPEKAQPPKGLHDASDDWKFVHDPAKPRHEGRYVRCKKAETLQEYTGREYQYFMPEILVEGKDADAANAEIEQFWKKNFTDGVARDAKDQTSFIIIEIDYTFFVTQNFLSLVYHARTDWESIEYLVITLDVTTGRRLSYAEVADLAGRFDLNGAGARYSLFKGFTEYYDIVPKQDPMFAEVLQLTMEDRNLEEAMWFFTEHGAWAITRFYSVAGAAYYYRMYPIVDCPSGWTIEQGMKDIGYGDYVLRDYCSDIGQVLSDADFMAYMSATGFDFKMSEVATSWDPVRETLTNIDPALLVFYADDSVMASPRNRAFMVFKLLIENTDGTWAVFWPVEFDDVYRDPSGVLHCGSAIPMKSGGTVSTAHFSYHGYEDLGEVMDSYVAAYGSTGTLDEYDLQ